ncbi:hypothetical protein H9P43_004903 [Blastocladiella emersonii ATCC 22665]|nr:hypothetical protein H9P43_004903 [Blastocladiella emersonii ATCC 22665]
MNSPSPSSSSETARPLPVPAPPRRIHRGSILSAASDSDSSSGTLVGTLRRSWPSDAESLAGSALEPVPASLASNSTLAAAATLEDGADKRNTAAVAAAKEEMAQVAIPVLDDVSETTPLLADAVPSYTSAAAELPPPISATAAATTARVPAYDLARGVIMVVMSLDHARKYLSTADLDARPGAEEDWQSPLPSYHASLAVFATRAITHLAAPGFFFLMGLGNVLFARSRLARGWSAGKMVRHGVVRGGILVALAASVLNDGIMFRGVNPSDKHLSGVRLSLGVMYALGIGMMVAMATAVGALRLVARFGAARISTALALLAVSVPLLCELVVNQYAATPMSDTAAIPWLLAFVPDTRGALQVMYPVVPWLAPMLWGVAYGLWSKGVPAARMPRVHSCLAIAFAAAFVVIRLIGGTGNIRVAGAPHASTTADPESCTVSLIEFLTLVKYPPSLAFQCATLAVFHAILAASFRAPSAVSRTTRALVALGQSSLFFYLAHVLLYFALGVAVKRVLGDGLSLAAMYPVWAAGLVPLYAACARYARFKHATAPESLWRLF